MAQKIRNPSGDTERLLGVIAALGSEVFVLKAQMERLTLALQASGALTEAQLGKTEASPELQRWMGEEEKSFGRNLMRPFTHPDEARDVTPMMDER